MQRVWWLGSISNNQEVQRKRFRPTEISGAKNDRKFWTGSQQGSLQLINLNCRINFLYLKPSPIEKSKSSFFDEITIQ